MRRADIITTGVMELPVNNYAALFKLRYALSWTVQYWRNSLCSYSWTGRRPMLKSDEWIEVVW